MEKPLFTRRQHPISPLFQHTSWYGISFVYLFYRLTRLHYNIKHALHFPHTQPEHWVDRIKLAVRNPYINIYAWEIFSSFCWTSLTKSVGAAHRLLSSHICFKFYVQVSMHINTHTITLLAHLVRLFILELTFLYSAARTHQAKCALPLVCTGRMLCVLPINMDKINILCSSGWVRKISALAPTIYEWIQAWLYIAARIHTPLRLSSACEL